MSRPLEGGPIRHFFTGMFNYVLYNMLSLDDEREGNQGSVMTSNLNPEHMRQIVNSVSMLLEKQKSSPNESETLGVLVDPMLDALGWNTRDLSEVRREYRHGTGHNPVDRALFLDGQPVLFVEAKALSENLDDTKWINQTLSYANSCNVPWACLTNGIEWRIYNVHARQEATGKLFRTIRVDEGACVDRFGIISKDSMRPKSVLDQMWENCLVDQQVIRLLSSVADEPTMIRAVRKCLPHVKTKDLEDSLRRIRISTIDEVMSASATDVEMPAEDEVTSGKRDVVRVSWLIESGLIRQGASLSIVDEPEHDATLNEDGDVEYRGEVMSMNAWVAKATGRKGYSVYRAVLCDGEPLKDIKDRYVRSDNG